MKTRLLFFTAIAGIGLNALLLLGSCTGSGGYSDGGNSHSPFTHSSTLTPRPSLSTVDIPNIQPPRPITDVSTPAFPKADVSSHRPTVTSLEDMFIKPRNETCNMPSHHSTHTTPITNGLPTPGYTVDDVLSGRATVTPNSLQAPKPRQQSRLREGPPTEDIFRDSLTLNKYYQDIMSVDLKAR